MLKIILPTIFSVFLIVNTIQAQKYEKRANQGGVLASHLSYAYEFSAFDLKARFGNNNSMGLATEWITPESNWIIGAKINYFFGIRVKEDVLSNLRTPSGAIIGNDRSVADIQLRERGFYTGIVLGKLFILPGEEKRSGIRVTASAGLLQHKIRIQDDAIKKVAQLNDDLKKGYDRLTNGLALNQFIGYQILSNSGRMNFIIGFEFTQGFTKNRRSYNYDTQEKDSTNRFDFQYGLRVGWTLPLYIGRESSEIFY